MVEIYQTRIDVNSYQWALPIDPQFTLGGGLAFNGTPRASGWDPPEFYIQNPTLEKGDFVHISAGCIGIRERVLRNSRAMECLEMAGEILPVRLEGGEEIGILNVTECVNALDKDRSKFSTYWDSSTNRMEIAGVAQFAFHPERFTESPIFKVPEAISSHVLACVGWRGSDCDAFQKIYQEEGFKGLVFERLWGE